jgi:hypothetical protein
MRPEVTAVSGSVARSDPKKCFRMVLTLVAWAALGFE